MREKPVETGEELVDRFGKALVDVFDYSLIQLSRKLTDTGAASSKDFLQYLVDLPEAERPLRIAQYGLETFIHDFMFMFQDSETFKIVGKLASGEEIDLKDLCPEGLHGNQLDWMEEHSVNRDIGALLLDKEFKQ